MTTQDAMVDFEVADNVLNECVPRYIKSKM
jgi:hypothetical protein